MAHTGIFATSDEIIKRAGANYNSTDLIEAVINDYAAQAESIINSLTKYNWSDKYATLNADVQRILSSCAAALCAIWIIAYDMTGYASRVHAEDMINVQRDSFLRDLSILKKIPVRDFMLNA